MDRGTRDELLGHLAEAVESVTVAHPTRVAIDGPPAAGKTTLADELAGAHAVLVFDGVFLMRPELIDRWDLRIFVSTALEKTVDRAVIRERRVSSRADVERRWRERYIPSQQLYFATVRPTDHADIIVHNDEPRQPAWQTRKR